MKERRRAPTAWRVLIHIKARPFATLAIAGPIPTRRAARAPSATAGRGRTRARQRARRAVVDFIRTRAQRTASRVVSET